MGFLPKLPGLPKFFSAAQLPGLPAPKLPTFPKLPTLPKLYKLPALPGIKIPSLLKARANPTIAGAANGAAAKAVAEGKSYPAVREAATRAAFDAAITAGLKPKDAKKVADVFGGLAATQAFAGKVPGGVDSFS